MTFLNPFLLFGLAAAAIPVILHLLNLRKLRTVEFSTLTFLKELQQTKIRRLKLRQLLLLIIRTLVVIFIVVAFARPTMRGTILGTIGSHAHSTVVFILDDSFSESAGDEHGERFKQVKEAVLRLTDLLKEGDDAFLIRLSDVPKATIEPAMHDFAALRAAVTETQISAIRRPMEDALRLASRLLMQSNNINKEIYLVSDMQRTLFSRAPDVNSQQPAPSFSAETKFFVVPIGSKNVANASIDSVRVISKILEKNKSLTISALIRNYGQIALHDNVVSIYLDGIRTAQRSVSIDAGSSASLDFSVTPKRTGFLKGYVELEQDNVEQDNRRYFTIHIPERINVAAVSNSPIDAQYLLLALRSGNTDTVQQLMNITSVAAQKLPLLDLKNVDVLCLANMKSFSSGDVDRIKSFVEGGGGLLLFPGEDIQPYNSFLLPALHIPPIMGIVRSPDQSPGYTFGKVDIDHPVFATMFEGDDRRRNPSAASIESPSIRITLQRQSGREGHTIIGLNDGSTFFSEHILGEGKVLFFSVAPLLSWSDFPLKGIFAPLIYRSAMYTALRGEIQPSFVTGEEAPLKVQEPRTGSVQSGQGDRHQFTLVSPDGIEELVQPTPQPSAGTGGKAFNSSLVFQLKRFTLPGYFELKRGSSTISLFSVNTDNRESDVRKVSDDEATAFWKRLNVPAAAVTSIEENSQLQSTIMQSRFGVELWRYCIGGAILLALLEMLIARDSRKASQQLLETQPA